MVSRLALVATLVGLSLAACAQSDNGVPGSLLAKLKGGVNVTRWFCYLQNPADANHFRTYLNEKDLAAFKRLHVSFVRLCISPEVIDDRGTPNAANLSHIDHAIQWLTRAGIAVIFDLHDNGQLKLDAPGEDNASFVSFWEAIARHYKGKIENSLIFELVNEPIFRTNPNVWYALQEQTVKAVRDVDPSRTIMVTSTSWSSIDTFATMSPLPQRNLVYTFHCYDPFFFTHQGASWVGDQPKLFKGMPFPSSPEAMSEVIAKNEIPPQFDDTLRSYGSQRFDAKYLSERMDKAMEWANKHHVPAVLGEFGSYPPVAPVDSRKRWFQGMRAAFTAHRVPYAIWGYDDAMGLGRRLESNGSLYLDPVTLKAFYGE